MLALARSGCNLCILFCGFPVRRRGSITLAQRRGRPAHPLRRPRARCSAQLGSVARFISCATQWPTSKTSSSVAWSRSRST